MHPLGQIHGRSLLAEQSSTRAPVRRVEQGRRCTALAKPVTPTRRSHGSRKIPQNIRVRPQLDPVALERTRKRQPPKTPQRPWDSSLWTTNRACASEAPSTAIQPQGRASQQCLGVVILQILQHLLWWGRGIDLFLGIPTGSQESPCLDACCRNLRSRVLRSITTDILSPCPPSHLCLQQCPACTWLPAQHLL